MAPMTPAKEPVQPITKQQAQEQKASRIFPDFVIQAFNECIAESQVKNSGVVMQKDVLKRIMKLGNIRKSQKVFDEHWLDVEDHYRKAGWKVSFDQPGYNESYEASYTFS